MNTEKRYALVGTGGRSRMYVTALCHPEKTHAGRLVGLCDINPGRMDRTNGLMAEKWAHAPVPTYGIDDFERMLREQKVDVVIVTTVDRTHHDYICRAMEAGCDAITEKPMTTDPAKCRRILETQARTGRKLTVTFNYRYAPRNSRVKELLMEGVIGEVKSVHFEWLLDTRHGADYFRRWHRDKRNSGGLMVHKATHHFDLVNWWLGSRPETVFAMGDLVFYGRANAEARGIRDFYQRATGNPHAARDPFALDLAKDPDEELNRLYYQQEEHDGYQRDQSVFGDGISIEDDMGVMVRYENQAVMTYHLTAYSPWEGYRVMFNGTQGRLEYEVVESAYVSGAEDDHNQIRNVSGGVPWEVREPASILVRPHWGKAIAVEMPATNQGGHGGGDKRLLRDVFEGGEADPLGCAAGHIDGALSILTGIAANQSMATGLPVRVRDLLDLPF